jgi:cell wall-associated NlpC family hydrolase
VLAVIAPIVETAERPAAAGSGPPSSTSPAARTPGFDPIAVLSHRSSRASRSAARSAVTARRAGVRPASTAVRQAARLAATRETYKIAVVRREARLRRLQQGRRAKVAAVRRAEAASVRRARGTFVRRAHAASAKRVVKLAVSPRRVTGMAAVLAYARAQVGKRYASGGDGPNSFDCSGFTKSAYARAGLRLPHSSGAQAARARSIPRWAARPGDLVVGPGHVGVYMGGGMMIDAGNRRTGVVYRRLYAGLHLARF